MPETLAPPISPADVQRLLASNPATVLAATARPAAILDGLDAKVAGALVAVRAALAQLDAEGGVDTRMAALDGEELAQSGVVEKCAAIVAKAQADGRPDLAQAAEARGEAAAAKIADIDAARAAWELLAAEGAGWVTALEARQDDLLERRAALPASAALASVAAPAAAPAAAPDDDPWAALEAAAPASAGGEQDWEAQLAKLMAETGARPSAELEAQAPSLAESDDPMAGIPDLIEVAADDLGEGASAEDIAAARGEYKPKPPAAGGKAATPAVRPASAPAVAKGGAAPVPAKASKTPAPAARAAEADVGGGSRTGLWLTIGAILAAAAGGGAWYFFGM